jgi:hypothetical protein
LLAASLSPDPGIGSSNPGDAESFNLLGQGYSNSVSGYTATGDTICFRIGLEQPFNAPVFDPVNPTYTSSWPARYATVELLYANHTRLHKIYLRQGEGADYLMRNSEPGTGLASRPNAIRFSPFNLTAPTGALDASNPYEILNTNGGSFTNYPSQAGAFFRWATATGRYAWSPFAVGISSFWNSVGGNSNINWTISQETCPQNYRRPTDNAAGTIANSEIRQSLWLNPQASNSENSVNSVYGYYADGFFDRRQIVNTSYRNSSAVSTGNRNIAYIGNIFFNPATNASLFFPRAGCRQGSGGAFDQNGQTGFYWTSTAYSSTQGWWMHLNDNSGVLDTKMNYSFGKDYGQSIRCVYAP